MSTTSTDQLLQEMEEVLCVPTAAPALVPKGDAVKEKAAAAAAASAATAVECAAAAAFAAATAAAAAVAAAASARVFSAVAAEFACSATV